MPSMSRRRFLLASGVTSAAALVAGSAGISWAELHRRAAADPLPLGSKILVLLTLYGGNDGLNTVIPYADSAYHDARPELAYQAEEVLRLDDSLGLNPAMTGLASVWKNNQLAIVRGVDYPNPDFSHFRSMDIWQTASPSEPVSTGWIGRWLDATGDDPIRAVHIGSLVPPLAVGARCAAAALLVGSIKPRPGLSDDALSGLAHPDPDDSTAQLMVVAGYRAERQVAATFDPVLTAGGAQNDDAGGPNSLKSQLDVVARCVKAGVPTRVYSVDLGGFDTHAGEKQTQQALLGVLDSALSSFLADMASDVRGKDVVVVGYSEFGRRVAANAAQGTDHGSAGPVLIAGVPVRGGFYGEQPSLTDLDEGNLKSTVDFRAVYSELIEKVLGLDPARVLDLAPPQLGFLA